MDVQSELVRRALGYPYAVPTRSFGLLEGRAVELSAIEVDLSARTALLAYGSNAAPEVLARKLGPSSEPVAALRGSLNGFDVAYSAHLSAYGSVPAALRASPGTEVPVFVVHLTDEQMAAIAPTEPNYELETLSGIACRLETGDPLTEAAAYASRHGCLERRDGPIALAAIEANGRTFEAMTQRRVLECVRDAYRPGEDLERFIVACATGATRPSPPLVLDRPEAS